MTFGDSVVSALPAGAMKPLKFGSIAASAPAVPGPDVARGADLLPSCRMWEWLAISPAVSVTVEEPTMLPITRGESSPGERLAPAFWLIATEPDRFGNAKLVVPFPP